MHQTSWEQNDLLTLDSELNFEFQSENSGNSRVSMDKQANGNKSRDINSEDFNCTLIGSFTSSSGSQDGGVALYYNENTNEVYAVELDANGDMVTQNGTVKAYDVFADTVNLQEGEEYTLSVQGGDIVLESEDGTVSYTSARNFNSVSGASVANSYFNVGRIFGNDDAFVSGLTASDAPGGFAEREEEETTEETEETEETKETEDSENTSETSADSESTGTSTAVTDTGHAVMTTFAEKTTKTATEEGEDSELDQEGNNAANQAQTSSSAEIPAPVIVNETPPANGGLLAALIFVAVLAAAAIGGCVYFFNKHRKEVELRQDAEKAKQDAQEQYSKLKISYDIAQHGSKQQELLLQDAQTENERLKQELRQQAAAASSAAASASVRSHTEEKLEEYRAKAEGWYSEYQRVEAENQRLAEAQRRQAERIRVLEAAAASSAAAEAAAAAEPVEEDTEIPMPPVHEDQLPEEVLISTSPAQLALYENVRFLTPNVSVTGDVSLTEASRKRAAIAVIGNQAYPNPHFFHDLAKGEESYNNLMSIKDVFELDGLKGGAAKYALDDVEPALVILEGDGSYSIERAGCLTLHQA